jgi:photosystem II biogenesis protein Psp29|mmetsp:Transcript_42589/g.106514  ORF Transcript_42589/g.106514 Transcript_42589/m.106514 type:complete len:312 (+) Transcript_42589:45-980(+)|eukprot:CAMPEP_0173435246 /NCGR_PEP_ID=MMETSP1357-20121228/14570_1 /TAXON_ID=77926 /ORGANISM="Hemiselmis rufescens, Strain PCC563" /LENGTH=311 /DNA_ID=CAMNT_0014400205 /DNA_START=44 /DNA_END=979 /DNA_ORIENTATION=-
MFSTKSAAIAALALATAAPEALAFMSTPAGGFAPALRPAAATSHGVTNAATALPIRRSLELSMSGSGKLADKFGHLRGADIEPCDKSVQRFYEIYGKPVPFVFRGATNEILYMSHLDLVNARFEYDALWACGVFSTFDVFFQGIDVDTRTKLFDALMTALKLEPATIRGDAEKVLSWAQGKSEADIVAAMNGEDSSEIGSILGKAKSAGEDDWIYTRNFGAGLIKTMQVVGVEPNTANAKKWAEALGISENTSAMTGLSMSRFESDVGVFLSSVEKFQQVIQLFAEVEAREKKKVAERLAGMAEEAAKEAA